MLRFHKCLTCTCMFGCLVACLMQTPQTHLVVSAGHEDPSLLQIITDHTRRKTQGQRALGTKELTALSGARLQVRGSAHARCPCTSWHTPKSENMLDLRSFHVHLPPPPCSSVSVPSDAAGERTKWRPPRFLHRCRKPASHACLGRDVREQVPR